MARRIHHALFALLSLVACHTSGQRPQPPATRDGLSIDTQAPVGFAAVKPDADLGSYRKLLVVPVEFSYQRGSRRLSQRRMEDLRRYLREDFTRELQDRGGYELVSQPGPGVLAVRAALVDIRVSAPADEPRTRSLVRQAGEVTLLAVFSDSQTGEVIARVADRRAVTSPGGAYVSNAVFNVSNTRRVFRQWASLLRERLDREKTASARP